MDKNLIVCQWYILYDKVKKFFLLHHARIAYTYDMV